MKKILSVALAVGVMTAALTAAPQQAQAKTDFFFGIFAPAPVYTPPVVYAPPPRVVYYPEPVRYYYYPSYYPAYRYYNNRDWRHDGRDHDDHHGRNYHH